MTERGDIWKNWLFAPSSAATTSLCAAMLALNQMSSYSAIMPRKHFLITPNELLMRSRLILMGTCGACRFLLHYGSTWTAIAIRAIGFSQLLVNWANFSRTQNNWYFWATMSHSEKARNARTLLHILCLFSISCPVYDLQPLIKQKKHCIQNKV